MARHVINQCKYISEKRLLEVEDVIRKLLCRHRLLSDDELSYTYLAQGDSKVLEPSIENLDEYMKQIYGEGSKNELTSKVEGTEMIMKLCNRIDNLEPLIQNRVLMSALARIIFEEHQQSAEITFNICRIFFALSSYVETLPILSSYRVGSSAMNLLDLAATRRYSSSEQKPSIGSDQVASQPNEYLIYAAIQLLMNIAEDPVAERKMVKKNLLPLLLQCITLPSAACVMVSLAFIHKLSVFEENALLLVDPSLKLMFLLTQLLSNESICDEIADAAVSVIFNLSFLAPCRDMLIEHRSITYIVNQLAKRREQLKTML